MHRYKTTIQQFCTDYPCALQDYAQIMHTPQHIMHGDYATIMHRRAIDYAVLKDYAEVFATLYRLPLRAPSSCTDYAHATKYFARILCTGAP